jgi:hypothetical protein
MQNLLSIFKMGTKSDLIKKEPPDIFPKALFLYVVLEEETILAA